MTRPTLLCVDADPSMRQLYRAFLSSCGYDVVVADNGFHALKLFNPRKIHAVVVDYEMPGMNGGEVAAVIKQASPDIPVVMVSRCQSVVEDAPRFLDAAVAKGSPLGRLVDKLEALAETARDRSAVPTISTLMPLGSALAALAIAALALSRLWR